MLPHYIRRLDNELELMLMCGFSTLPHWTTFDRFITRLSLHQSLVIGAQIQLTEQLKLVHPDLGNHIAVDSTRVRTHLIGLRVPKITGQVSDPEAGKTAKVNSRTGKMEWSFGYRQHVTVDSSYQIPTASLTTPANRQDSPMLSKLLGQAKTQFAWFAPKGVLADKGYDAL